MIGVLKGAFAYQAAVFAQFAFDAVNFRNLKRFFLRQFRQNGVHSLRQHGFARARHSDHQHIVTARRRYLQCPFGKKLSLHIGKIILHLEKRLFIGIRGFFFGL